MWNKLPSQVRLGGTYKGDLLMGNKLINKLWDDKRDEMIRANSGVNNSPLN